jgi:multidrug resistance efflux pump
MRRTVLVTLLIVVAFLAIAGGVGLYIYNSYMYYSTDDAQVSSPIANVSAPATGLLSTLKVNLGDTVTAKEVIGTITTSSVSATGAPVTVNVISPISGKVIQVSAVQGQAVAPGLSLLEIANLSNLTVTAYVDEGQMNNIKLGQQVDIHIDAYSGTTFTGHVQQIVQATAATFSLLPTEDNASGNFTKVGQRIPVIVTLDGTNGDDIVPGMSAEVTIHLH